MSTHLSERPERPERETPTPVSPKIPAGPIIYPAPQKNGRILKTDDVNREGFNLDKLEFALRLPFNPAYTETLFHLEKIEDLDVDNIRRYIFGLVLDVDGTLIEHHGAEPTPAVVEKLREMRDKIRKVCIFSNNAQGRAVFEQLNIPVVKHAAPKPDPAGFDRAARYYLGMNPRQCAMVGDNILTDGGARRIGMHFILVDPIPGPEGFFHKLTRGYGRAVKKMHDKLYGTRKAPLKRLK